MAALSSPTSFSALSIEAGQLLPGFGAGRLKAFPFFCLGQCGGLAGLCRYLLELYHSPYLPKCNQAVWLVLPPLSKKRFAWAASHAVHYKGE